MQQISTGAAERARGWSNHLTPVTTTRPGRTQGRLILNRADHKFELNALLAEIGQQHVLFSAARQEIYEVNDTAAQIWKALESGAAPGEIGRDLVARGTSAQEAQRLVEAALRDWEEQELIQPSLSSIQPLPDQADTQHIALSDIRLRLSYPAVCAADLRPLFRHLEAPETGDATRWDIAQTGGRSHFFREGAWVGGCASDETPAVLKGHLLNEVLSRATYDVAIHAATLLCGDRALLLFGAPGAGKTTLSLGLVQAGFGFGGDDVALVRAGGLCRPLPFASAVKDGSMPLLQDHIAGLGQLPVFRRPDGKQVRYVLPEAPLTGAEGAVGWIILLDWRAGSAAELHPVEAGEALQGVLADSFAQEGELTLSGFRTLARVLGDAQVYRLRYSGLEEAVALIGRMCR